MHLPSCVLGNSFREALPLTENWVPVAALAIYSLYFLLPLQNKHTVPTSQTYRRLEWNLYPSFSSMVFYQSLFLK